MGWSGVAGTDGDSEGVLNRNGEQLAGGGIFTACRPNSTPMQWPLRSVMLDGKLRIGVMSDGIYNNYGGAYPQRNRNNRLYSI